MGGDRNFDVVKNPTVVLLLRGPNKFEGGLGEIQDYQAMNGHPMI